MSFTKHVGLDNAKNIIIMTHQIPGEEHMCLVVYPDKMPPLYLQHLTRVLNSAAGQAAKNLMDEAFKMVLPDGRNLLTTLHTEGHLKKRPTKQVFVQPDSRNKIYLSELNDMLSKIEEGGAAAQKLEQFDAGRGINKKAEQKKPNELESASDLKISADTDSGLPTVSPLVQPNDTDLIAALHTNSQKLMETANLLIEEAKSLEEKAAAFLPVKRKGAKNTPKNVSE